MKPLLLLALLSASAFAVEKSGSRFAYLDERDPYYPGLGSAKLTTPMWVGEDGVEAAVHDLANEKHIEQCVQQVNRRAHVH